MPELRSGRAIPADSLESLPDLDTLAVIINVSTRVVSTLALVSTLRHTNLPVVMIDCESTDGSYAFFSGLETERDFYLLRRPLMSHGKALDAIFDVVRAKRVLLVDSDIEIKDSRLVPMLIEQMDARPAWGSGFLHEAGWLTPPAAVEGWFVERMWIPLVLLDVASVRVVRRAQVSFDHRKVPNDVDGVPWLSYLLSLRFVFKFFRLRRWSFLAPLRGTIRHKGETLRPAFIYYDTGADVFNALQSRSPAPFRFASISHDYSGSWLSHQHGITRKKLRWWDSNSTKESHVVDEIAQKLTTDFGIQV